MNRSMSSDRPVLICNDDVVTSSVVPDVLLLLAYLWALYLFRVSETEHLSTLIETVSKSTISVPRPTLDLCIFLVQVFLSYNSRFVMHSQRSLVNVLL